jgi:hypothetical protein
MCQGEGGGEALVAVLLGEDGEQDAFHRGLVLEGAHRPGAPADLSEAALDGVGGAHGAALGRVAVAKAGEQVVEVALQAAHRLRVEVLPVVGEAAGGRAAGRVLAFMIRWRSALTLGWSALPPAPDTRPHTSLSRMWCLTALESAPTVGLQYE